MSKSIKPLSTLNQILLSQTKCFAFLFFCFNKIAQYAFGSIKLLSRNFNSDWLAKKVEGKIRNNFFSLANQN